MAPRTMINSIFIHGLNKPISCPAQLFNHHQRRFSITATMISFSVPCKVQNCYSTYILPSDSPLMISTGNYPECLVLILLNVNISSNNIQGFGNLKPTLICIVILLIQNSEHVFGEMVLARDHQIYY
jgi:hypothetical protein